MGNGAGVRRAELLHRVPVTRSLRDHYGADLAYIHDAGFGALARRAGPALVAELRARGIRRGLVVELGCGSGILAARLGRAGYDVLGVDVSPAMLRLAKRAAPGACFVRASLHEFPLPRCEAVLALGEGLAYVPVRGRAPSLRRLFARVARALRPGGLFAFDLIVKGGSPRLDARGFRATRDWAVLSEVQERGARLERRITTFRRVGASYRRSVETHVQRLVRRDEVTSLLRGAGFRVSTVRAYGKVELLPRRLAFFATRL